MAASKITTRVRALDFAVASSSDEDTPTDIIRRAQIYADWIDGVFTIKLEYEINTAPEETDAANVVPIKPKPKR